MDTISLKVNGKDYTVPAGPGISLQFALRDPDAGGATPTQFERQHGVRRDVVVHACDVLRDTQV